MQIERNRKENAKYLLPLSLSPIIKLIKRHIS